MQDLAYRPYGTEVGLSREHSDGTVVEKLTPSLIQFNRVPEHLACANACT